MKTRKKTNRSLHRKRGTPAVGDFFSTLGQHLPVDAEEEEISDDVGRASQGDDIVGARALRGGRLAKRTEGKLRVRVISLRG